jgi:hypothetical protein
MVLTSADHLVLKIAPLLDKEPSVQRDLVLAMIAQRILTPGSKLFTTRVLQQPTLALKSGEFLTFSGLSSLAACGPESRPG